MKKIEQKIENFVKENLTRFITEGKRKESENFISFLIMDDNKIKKLKFFKWQRNFTLTEEHFTLMEKILKVLINEFLKEQKCIITLSINSFIKKHFCDVEKKKVIEAIMSLGLAKRIDLKNSSDFEVDYSGGFISLEVDKDKMKIFFPCEVLK